MPIHKRAPVSSSFISSPSYAGLVAEIICEEVIPGLEELFPLTGEITHSFDVSDTPGGWHLVWLDKAFEFEGVQHAHLMVAPRWVARPLKLEESVPVHIRFVPDVALVELGAPDVEALPLAGRGLVTISEDEG